VGTPLKAAGSTQENLRVTRQLHPSRRHIPGLAICSFVFYGLFLLLYSSRARAFPPLSLSSMFTHPAPRRRSSKPERLSTTPADCPLGSLLCLHTLPFELRKARAQYGKSQQGLATTQRWERSTNDEIRSLPLIRADGKRLVAVVLGEA